ncbi:S49 family peptidase [Flavobacterium oncorhynchi]|uniref:S49 family peptidase n=1 Tax=Flavobacterium oncorhynchi TaxID=728056 RepID=UPI003519F912
MSQNLDTLFSGKFYIDDSYGIGLVPSLISFFNGKNFIEKTEAEKIKSITRISVNGNMSSIEADLSSQDKKIVVIDFKQPVVKYSTYYWLGTQVYINILNRLKNDPTVIGVVVDSDSGGGQVYGTPEMYDTVADFAKVKPIGFYTNGYMCSGMYYIAAPGTFIMANKRADAIGSIGGYTIIVNYNGLLEKYGAKVSTLYSDLSPEKNESYRGVIDGTDENGEKYIKKELNPMVNTFHTDMKSARPQLNVKVFLGGVWNGEEALSMGLIDLNGSLIDAINEVNTRAEEMKKAQSNNKTNLKTKTMSKNTKSFPLIQGIIGAKTEGFGLVSTISGKKGIQITEEHLGLIETALSGHDTAIKTEKDNVTAEKGKVTLMETAITTALEKGGLTASVATDATNASKIELLGSKVAEYGKRPGAIVTTPKSDGDSFEEKDSIVNASDAHNELYNKA